MSVRRCVAVVVVSAVAGVLWVKGAATEPRPVPVRNASQPSSRGASPRFVTMPSLVGATREDATARLRDLGLDPIRAAVPDPSVPSGRVIRTTPPAGTRVKTGESVGLYISTGAPGPRPTVLPPTTGVPHPTTSTTKPVRPTLVSPRALP